MLNTEIIKDYFKELFFLDRFNKNQSLIWLEKMGIGPTVINAIFRWYKTLGFNAAKQLEFITDFSTWLSDGSSPKDACLSIINSARAQGKETPEAKVAQSIYSALKDGKSVDVGMEDWFDKEVITLFRVGQEAGVLPSVVENYLGGIQEMSKIKKEYVTALIKPMIYSLFVTVILILIGKFGMPAALEGKSLMNYPASFHTLHDVSTFLAQTYAYFLVLVFAFLVGYRHLRDNFIGPFRSTLNKFFPLSINKAFSAMKMLKTLAIMLKAKQGLFQSCDLLRKEETPFMQFHYQQIMKNCAEIDGSAAELLDTGLLTPRLYERLSNASNISGDKAKQEAIAIAGARSGQEAANALILTKKIVVGVSWLVTAGLLVVLLSGALAYMSSLSNF